MPIHSPILGMAAAVLLLVFCTPGAFACEVGPQLQAALDSDKSIWLSQYISHFREAADALMQQGNVRGRARIKIGVCYFPGERPRLNLGSTTGTLRELLDRIAANTGYTWEANGDWINFTPLTEPVQMGTVMHRRIPGKAIVSRNKRDCTDVRGMLGDMRGRTGEIKVLKFLLTPEQEAQREERLKRYPDPIVLNDPTVWQFLNAEHELYGWDYYGTKVNAHLSSDGKSVKFVWLDFWGAERFGYSTDESP